MLNAWLQQLCTTLPGVRCAVLYHLPEVSSTNASALIRARWPASEADATGFTEMLPLLKARVAPVVSILDGESAEQKRFMIAYPMALGGATRGALVVEISAAPSQQNLLLTLLEWGDRWLQLLLQAQSVKSARLEQSGTEQTSAKQDVLITMMNQVIQARDLKEASMSLVNDVARYWQFERVSLGVRRGKSIELEAISHSADFDPRSNLVRSVIDTLNQGLSLTKAQHLSVATDLQDQPSSGGGSVKHRGHDKESDRNTGRDSLDTSTQLIVPIMSARDTGFEAVLLCQNPSGQARNEPSLVSDPSLDDPQTLAELDTLSLLVAPILAHKQQAEMSLRQLIVERLRLGLAWRSKSLSSTALAGLGFGGLLLLAALIDGPYRVKPQASLEATLQRAVVAPFDTYISAAHFRAGDQVAKDDVLAQLDDRALRLERDRWYQQREEYRKQFRKELVGLSPANSAIIKAQMAQADAEIELVDERLGRARLRAPISGLIVEGDLSRSLGAPVKQGEVLFEVAPLDEYRVVMKVSEQDMPNLRSGQTGQLVLRAYPDQPLALQVEKVAITFQQHEERIWYRTEARLDNPDNLQLRPGMEGVAKVEVAQRSYLWIATHQLLDWFRIWWWSWTL